MSQSSAIASVTAALFHLLDNAGINVTTLSPNNVNAGSNEQINLFLYATEINPAFRNDPMPGAVPPGRPGPPPLALVLRYLITAYGDNSIDFSVHEILGKAMLVGPGSILDAHTADEKIFKQDLLDDVDLYERLVRKLLA